MSYRLMPDGISERDRTILKVLRLYYEHDLTQAEVARRLSFSRPKVTKLIAEGRQRGLLNIEIGFDGGQFAELEIALENRFHLHEVRVVGTEVTGRETDLAVGAAGAAMLGSACGPRSRLGISWGHALRGVADAMPLRAFTCQRVVPLLGGMGAAKAELHANMIGSTIAAKLGVQWQELAAPAMAPSTRTRQELTQLSGIREMLEAANSCDVAAVGIGGILPTSTMIEAGYFDREEFLRLADRGAAGDIASHFIDARGRPCLPHISKRVVGITLDQLRAIPCVIGVASSAAKAIGVAAALRGGFVSNLACDEELARDLLKVGMDETGGTHVR